MDMSDQALADWLSDRDIDAEPEWLEAQFWAGVDARGEF